MLKKGLGIWQILNSNLVTDIIGKAGFDITILDLEHGLHTPNSIQDCIFASKSSSLFTVVRLPNDFYTNLVQLIDTGIDAILFPHVETESELDNIIKQTFLYPDGNKSFSPFVQRFNYGISQSKIERNPYLGILIESKLGIKNARKLLKNPLVDFVYFGAYDLSVELSKPGEIFDEEVLEYLIFLVKEAKKEGKKLMSLFRNEEELEVLMNLDIDFPIASVDTSHLILKLKKETELYKKF